MTATSPAFDALTTDWFADALSAPVVGARIEPTAFSGATTDLARVRLTYAEGGRGPSSLIAKMTSRDEVRAQMDAAMGLFPREAHFYDAFADRVPLRSARCYHAGDGQTTPLLLEDLARLRMGDQLEGLTLADAARVIDALAALHAQFWGSATVDEPWLMDPSSPAYAATFAKLIGPGAALLAERYAGQVPDAVVRGTLDHVEQWQSVIERGVTGPPTVVHFDARLDNVFFEADGTPVFIDFQTVARARGTHDVALLLTQSMDAELLAANWESLLRQYHSALGAAGVADYEWEDCLRHYRQNVLFNVGVAMALLGPLAMGDERGLADCIAVRALNHARDVDGFGAL